MTRRLVWGFFFAAGCVAWPQPAGLPPEWEVRKMLAELSALAQRFQPILDQLNPRSWVAAGAPETYVTQVASTKKEVGYLVATGKALAERPEKLSLALETLFRMQAIEAFLRSLSEGVRRYQNPALADLLDGVMGETLGSRERLRQYVVELAAVKEDELAVMNQEAQRCRAAISRQPAPRQTDSRGEKR
ncbi:MAG: hypothetical protein HY822_12150 [Acidobacteria bacterium]|nr:hypothetical protein [Acidobacteriota bacterium]